MSRRPLGLALLALAITALTPTVAASADPSWAHTPKPEKQVCAKAPAGYASCHAHVLTKDDGVTPHATTSYTSGFAPAQLRSAYSTPASTTTTTVAIVDAYANPNAAVDLAAYRTQFVLGTANLTQVNQSGGNTMPAGDVGWGQEEMLDLEMVSAICPTCKILYVGANSASFADLGTAVNTAAAMGATVISNSYGGAEWSGETAYQGAYNHPNVAITVSSGDSGYGVQVPAAFNTVTAVGGTSLTLYADGTRNAETVWSGAGSGCSAYITKPSWQKDTGCSRRTVADVAAVADPNTGVAVYDSYGSTGGANWLVFGGTSVAAPIIGAVYALSGNTAGVPAALAYSATAGSLYDVTAGANRSKCRSYLCRGTSGYDGPTGNGTPNGTVAF